MVNLLESMFNRQEKFEKLFYNFKGMTIKQKETLTKDFILHLIAEAMEVLRETEYKDWRKNNEAKRGHKKITSIIEEIIDLQHWTINLALLWGVNPFRFASEFFKKNDINWDRQYKSCNIKKSKKRYFKREQMAEMNKYKEFILNEGLNERTE